MEMATRIKSGHILAMSFQSITWRPPVESVNSASMWV